MFRSKSDIEAFPLSVSGNVPVIRDSRTAAGLGWLNLDTAGFSARYASRVTAKVANSRNAGRVLRLRRKSRCAAECRKSKISQHRRRLLARAPENVPSRPSATVTTSAPTAAASAGTGSQTKLQVHHLGDDHPGAQPSPPATPNSAVASPSRQIFEHVGRNQPRRGWRRASSGSRRHRRGCGGRPRARRPAPAPPRAG